MVQRTLTTQDESPESGDGLGAPSHIIQRPRLTKILDETEARIILLCAPAGYGKTTLARQWVATRSEPVLWYSGGPAMADVAALAVDLAELFAAPESDLSHRVQLLASQRTNVRALSKTLASASPALPTTVVVDDYHHIEPGSDSDALVRELVGLTGFRLVMATRVLPDWTDSRRVVYGELLVVDQSALAFTSDEAATVIPRESVVLEHAEGWPAVIGLAAIRGGRSGLETPVDPDALYEFIATELFAGADPRLRQALFLLAAGGSADRSIASSLLGNATDDVLDAANRRGFLVDDHAGWMAMHPLIREFLLRRLGEIPSPRRHEIVLTTIAALSDSGRWDQCLSLLSAVPDDVALVRVIEASFQDLLQTGRTATLRRLVDLAAATKVETPILLLAESELELRGGKPDAAEAVAVEAARRLEGDLAARAYITASRAAHMGENSDAVARYAERAAAVTSNEEIRREALFLTFLAAIERQDQAADAYYEELCAFQGATTEFALRVACANVVRHFQVGSIRDALRNAESALALIDHTHDPMIRTNVLNVLAHMLVVLAEYERALDVAAAEVEEAEQTGLDFVKAYGLVHQASAHVGLRQIGAAKVTLRELQALGIKDPNIAMNVTLLSVRLRVAVGDVAGAAAVLQASPPSGISAGLLGEYHAHRGMLAAAQNRSDAAETHFAEALRAAHVGDTVLLVDLGRAISAIEQQSADSTELAVEAIGRAFDRDHRDSVVLASREYPALVACAVGASTLAPALTELFAASRDRDLARRAGLVIPREMRRTGGLTKREREVLSLIRAGRTNLEIARTLFISESTAKVHIRHIFDKLGVRSRIEAVAATEGEVLDG